jgi:hypothetical protein
MLRARFRGSRQRSAGFPVLHASLLLWNLSLLCFAASVAGHLALAQQKTAVAPAGGPFNAAGMGTGSRKIDGLWQFHLGDDPQWAQPGFDDSKWEQLPANKPWKDVGHPNQTGFAWYRRKITLDPADKNPLALFLSGVYGVAEVYWNGVKQGGVGTPPPHESWYFNPLPAVVPLPSVPGASSGTLAIRIWVPGFRTDLASDRGGFPRPRLGYAPLIRQMQETSFEHNLHLYALRLAVWLVVFCAGLIALIFWSRSPSQWILLCVAGYFIPYVGVLFVQNLMFSPSMKVVFARDLAAVCVWQTAFLFLILLLAGLPNRPGVRGFRFWNWVCLAASAISLSAAFLGELTVVLAPDPHPAFYSVLSESNRILNYTELPFMPLVFVGCLVFGKRRLSNLLFMSAVALNQFRPIVSIMIDSLFPNLHSMGRFLNDPLFDLGGSPAYADTITLLLLLLAVVYAVWDQLSRELAQQRRANAELKAAQEVQTLLIAAEERGATGYAVASVYRPASEVGGDFFQVIPLEEDGTLIVAGDVSGKGLRAAMTVSLIVGAVRALAEQDSSPAAVLAGLNRRLVGRTQGGFATCCVVRIDPEGHATMANAGHCQPYLDGREVELPAGLPLGLVDGMTYDEIAVEILHGQQLTLVSDGVVEARNDRGELYGFERLSDLMRDRPTAEHVANTAIDFGQDDDITVLTVTRLAMEPEAAMQLSGLSPLISTP